MLFTHRVSRGRDPADLLPIGAKASRSASLSCRRRRWCLALIGQAGDARRAISTALATSCPNGSPPISPRPIAGPDRCGEASDRKARRHRRDPSELEVFPIGTEGYRTAEVSSVRDTAGLNSRTMEAKAVDGL